MEVLREKSEAFNRPACAQKRPAFCKERGRAVQQSTVCVAAHWHEGKMFVVIEVYFSWCSAALARWRLVPVQTVGREFSYLEMCSVAAVQC